MVLGIITAVVACPAIIGTTEAVRSGQRNNIREEYLGRQCNLTVTLLRPSCYSTQFNGAPIVLRDGKLFVDTRKDPVKSYFPATVNYYPFPGKKDTWRAEGYAQGEGLVTTINDQQFLNWVFVDAVTYEVKYGVKAVAEPHDVGPFGYTKINRRLTLHDWEGFIAVQENDGDEMWALYFDCKDNGLTAPGQVGNQDKRMLEVEVWRKEAKRALSDAVEEREERLELRKES